MVSRSAIPIELALSVVNELLENMLPREVNLNVKEDELTLDGLLEPFCPPHSSHLSGGVSAPPSPEPCQHAP